jgi:hypothetical protein
MIDIYADEKHIQAAAYSNEYYEPKYFKNRQMEQVETITSMSQIRG